MTDPIIVSLIALFSAIIGAFIQSVLARNFERSKFVRDQRRSAYQKFLVALGDLSQHPKGSSEWLMARTSVVDARCQIALFGTSTTIRALVDVFRNSATFDKPEDQERLCKAIGAMRHDGLGGKDGLDNDVVYELVFADGSGNLR